MLTCQNEHLGESAFCLPKGCRTGGTVNHRKVKSDMFQLLLGQKNGGGGVQRRAALKEKNRGH